MKGKWVCCALWDPCEGTEQQVCLFEDQTDFYKYDTSYIYSSKTTTEMIFSSGDASDYDYEPWACWQVNVPLGKCWFLPTQGSKGSNLTPPNKVLRNFISIQIAKTHELGSTASGTYRYGSAVKAEWVRVTLNWLRCIRTFTAENISQRLNYRLQALSYTNYVRTLDTTWTGLWKWYKQSWL